MTALESSNDLRAMLDRVQGIRHACDLDLLLFFLRNNSALLTNAQIVASVGYDTDRVAKSLDGLVAVGLLTRSRATARSARLYRLTFPDGAGGLLSSLLKVASTRLGRQAILRLLDAELGQTPLPDAGLSR